MADHSKHKEDARVTKVVALLDASTTAYKDQMADSERAWKYVNHDSWTASALSYNKQYKKPSLKYNIIMPILMALQGQEQTGRKKAHIKARRLEDMEAAEIMQMRWNAIEDEQNIEEMLQMAFLDMLISKMGANVEIGYKIDDYGYLEYMYRLANGFLIHKDPEQVGSNIQKSRWIIKESWVSLEVLLDRYKIDPNLVKTEASSEWWRRVAENLRYFAENKRSNLANYDKVNDTYRVLELQERTTRELYLIWEEDSGYSKVAADEIEYFKEQYPELDIIQNDKEEQIHILTVAPYFKNVVLYDDFCKEPGSKFDIESAGSYDFNISMKEVTSLVDLLLDIQDDINLGKSQTREWITQRTSGALFTAKRESETTKDMKKYGTQPGKIYTLKSMNNLPKRVGTEQIPPDVLMNSENSYAYGERISLIGSVAKGGDGKSGESYALFQAKLDRVAAVINPYFKNLSKLRKALVERFVDNFGWVYAEDNRIIDVKDKDGTWRQEMINITFAGESIKDLRNVSLHVELDEGESSMTAQEEHFEKLMAVFNMISSANPQIASALSMELLANAPIKGVEKMVQIIQEQISQQSQDAEKIKDLELAKKQLENLAIERGWLTDEEELEIKHDKNKIEMVKAQAAIDNANKDTKPEKK